MIVTTPGTCSSSMMEEKFSSLWHLVGKAGISLAAIGRRLGYAVKYQGTDLVKEEPVKENYFSPEIEFVECKPISRLSAANVSIL